MAKLFELPEEILATLSKTYLGREPQIRALATLVYPRAAPCPNLILHGTEATGKSVVTRSLLAALQQEQKQKQDQESNPKASPYELNYAIVKSAECVTARHLFERTVGLVADSLSYDGGLRRCETLAALTVELTRMLKYVERDAGWRFVLVFDGIDRQREAPPTLLPALARLSEIIPNLTTIFILTTPSPSLLRVSSVPHLHFPPYTKPQYISILASSTDKPPTATLPNTSPQETLDLWTRFAAAVHDSLARPAARTLPSLRAACAALWPRFTAPVLAGTLRARDFSKLLVAARAYLGDENVLMPGISLARSRNASTDKNTNNTKNATTDLTTLLPPTARLLLISAYLASHNPTRHDALLFSTWHPGKRSRRGGRRGGRNASHTPGGVSNSSLRQQSRYTVQKHRKIARKLLGPGVFVLERMVAIYVATRREWIAADSSSDAVGKTSTVDGDVGMAIATLASLRLLVKVGGGAGSGAGAQLNAGGADLDRGGRWRVNVGWEVIRGVGRSMGVEVEEWLVE
ncbi:origin recognition complex subunit Orc5 [Xylariaceae sp. FL0016]|nr:origin recognition complex subunit Orc5 [Xylariaceae sp. FL0016]